LCQIAKVSKGGYYKWLKLLVKPDKDQESYFLIRDVFEKGRHRLGWRRIKMNLQSKTGVIMNHKKIKRIKNKYGLTTKIRSRNPYKDIMRKTSEHRTFENVLNRNFKQIVPRKSFCSDITYLYYGYGLKAYLQAIKDVATKEIVSWELSNNLALNFVLKSIDNLKNIGILENQSIIHSDQGAHYTSPEYIKKVKDLNLVQSMSRKGSCIDNAPIESFFGHLKDEVEYREARTFNELSDTINKYMEYYNNGRYQWEIKKMTPVQYRDHLLAIQT
jgi:putative transposase